MSERTILIVSLTIHALFVKTKRTPSFLVIMNTVFLKLHASFVEVNAVFVIIHILFEFVQVLFKKVHVALWF